MQIEIYFSKADVKLTCEIYFLKVRIYFSNTSENGSTFSNKVKNGSTFLKSKMRDLLPQIVNCEIYFFIYGNCLDTQGCTTGDQQQVEWDNVKRGGRQRNLCGW